MDDDPFSPWGLRPVELADRPRLDRYFASLAEPLSDYTFSQLYTWRNSLRILWREMHGHLCVFANGTGDLTLLMPPIGDTGGDRAMSAAFELMNDYNAVHGVPDRSRVEYVSDELLARFDRTGTDVCRMGADYVYDVGRMIELAGGDLASKRQAKGRFLRNYAHRVEPYDAARHLEDCRGLLEQWRNHQDGQHALGPDADTGALKRHKESLATDLCLQTASELGLEGMVVYVQSADASSRHSAPSSQHSGFSLQGFTFGEKLGRDQASITIEKTDLGTKGLAQFIFSEFCRRSWADRPFVNVGDDWGIETLAWTKMSYRPAKLLQKYVLRRTAAVTAAAMPAGAAGGRPGGSRSGTQSMFEFAAPVVSPRSPASGAFVVREARKDDLEAAVGLERTCFGDGGFSLTKRQLQYLYRRPTAVFTVAEQGGQVVGEGIALVRKHKNRQSNSSLSGRIYSVAVHPGCRGQGVGESLVRALCDALCERGVRRIYLEVETNNTGATRLYERLGFHRTDTLADYYGPGRPAVHMVYEVAAAVMAG
jgi:ribosomal protein S18 acetylase RimI-like enzyme